MATEVEKDHLSGVETTGHEWDGLKELNNPLPKWWLYVLYACIAWAVVYWVLYPAWPLGTTYTKGILGYSSRATLFQKMDEARQSQAQYLDAIAKTPLDQLRGNAELLNFSLAGGRTMFNENCVPCHGAGGQGGHGYPNLADDKWMWGGTLADIYQTIQHGIRADDPDTRISQMPRFGADGVLTRPQIDDTAEFVLSLTGTSTDAEAAKRGAVLFAENCVACHGDKGQGTAEVGAPALNDGIWLYGGDKKTVVETITYARGGVMPAWSKRLDDTTIKQLAVYVHELGGGK
ncbi:MAG: cytochrome-c oxidase, cbb3-type subunit III [Azospirillum sp.]|nr:cytochrome-c oxidase, cbb3-type subunit III [Azospirillum sp.]